MVFPSWTLPSRSGLTDRFKVMARLLLECLLGPDTVTATEAELVLGAGLGLDTSPHRAQPGQAGTEGAQHIRILNITKIIVKHIALVRWVL